MKKLLLAGAALGALTIGAQAADLYRAPAQAKVVEPSRISGDLSFYGGWFQFSDSSDYSFNGSVIGGLGRANIWIAPNMSVQFDLSGENVVSTFDDDNYSVINLAGHWSLRNPGYLLGAFVSIGAQDNWWNARFGTIGIEGQTYVGPLQLYVQVGYTGTLQNADNMSNVNALYGHVEARYFINPNLMLAANVGIAHERDIDGSETYNPVRWGADLETKFGSSVFGGFLSYQGSHESYSGYSFTNHAVLAGLKIHFNNATLQSAAQAGATLKDMNPLTGVNHLRLNNY